MRKPTILELVRAQIYAQKAGNLVRVRKLEKIIRSMVSSGS